MTRAELIRILRADKARALADPDSCESHYGTEFSDVPYPCRPTCECALRDFILENEDE